MYGIRKLDRSIEDTSTHASSFVLFWTRKLLLKRTLRWLGIAALSGLLLVTNIERIHTPPRSGRDWWGTIIELGIILYATYKAQLYNESALVTGLALDHQLQDEPYTEVLVRQPKRHVK